MYLWYVKGNKIVWGLVGSTKKVRLVKKRGFWKDFESLLYICMKMVVCNLE